MTDTDASEDAKPGKLRYSDEDMLRFVRDERRHSIGFGETDGGELLARRERSLLYYKGDVTKDIPNVDRRSQAVSTDVAEAIDTAVPDLAEIFLSGEDIITFSPEGEEDEQQARDETDFIQKTLFQSNPGFVIFTTAFKDALLLTTGLFHWWYEETQTSQSLVELPPEQAELAPAIQAQFAMQADPEQANQLQVEQREDGSTAMSLPQLKGKICYRTIPPEDFTVAQDTVGLPEATYCAYRERARVQALIERGLDADLVRELPDYSKHNEAIDRARDEAGETDRGVAGSSGDLRIVEVRHHYIRVDRDDDGDTELWCVITDSEEETVLSVEEVDHVPFSALTPYMSAHRFYGESVADRLLEIQRIKTTLLRMMLDSGYFALNQRMAVDMTGANEFTIPDLLRNEPNMPVRMDRVGTVVPLEAGQLGFDVFGAMEYASTMGEQRTGIVRNAQGLNPDTLHDTAAGAMQLINAAQKRLRFIARVFAETGIKELCLGIHRTMRCNWSDEHAPLKGKFGKNWKSAQPHTWPEREDMNVHVGPVSKDHELAMLSQQTEMVNNIIQGVQGGSTDGPFVSKENVYNLLNAWSRAAGQKSPELYWSDPKSPEMQQAVAQQAQKPNPEMAKVQAQVQAQQQQMQMQGQLDHQKAQNDMQLRQSQAQSDAQLEASKVQADLQAAERKAARDHELAMQKVATENDLASTRAAHEFALKREQMVMEINLKREGMEAELELKRELGHAQIASQHEIGKAKASAANIDGPNVGGEPG